MDAEEAQPPPGRRPGRSPLAVSEAKDGDILANGGRVLNVCASGKTVVEARQRAYAAIDRIKWPEGFCRRDIGWQAVEMLLTSEMN